MNKYELALVVNAKLEEEERADDEDGGPRQAGDGLVTESYLLVVEGLPRRLRPVDPATFAQGGA